MKNFKINPSGILLIASEIVFIAFPMLSMIALNVFLTTSQYGELVYGFTLCSFYSMFVIFGVDILGSRLIHESDNPVSVYCEITIFKAINFGIGFLPFIVVLYLTDSLDRTIIFLPLVVSEVFGLAVYYLGRDATRSLLVYRLLSKGIGLLILILFLISGIGPISYPISLLCTMVMDTIWFVFLIRDTSRITFSKDKYLAYLKDSWPLAASSMLVMGVSGGARVYINNLFGSAVLGLFDILDRVVRGFKVFQLVYNKYLVTFMLDSRQDILKHFKRSVLLNASLTIGLYLFFYSILQYFLDASDVRGVRKFVHLIPTVFWVGMSQYLSFVLSVIWRKSFFQLFALVLGFIIFYSIIVFVGVVEIEYLVWLINIQELAVLGFLGMISYSFFKRMHSVNRRTV